MYLSNENDKLVDVFFDDFKVKVTQSPVIQETAYYPFGLSHATSYQRAFTTKNPFLFNGMERDEKTGWDDFGARMYMADIGRWGVIDPLSEQMRRWSPYYFAFNNPLRFIDPDGMSPVEVNNPEKLKKAADNAVQAVEKSDTNGQQPARCNVGVVKAFRELTGSKELDNTKDGNMDNAKKAAQIMEHLRTENERGEDGTWVSVDIEKAQELANNGEIIVGGDDGHVVMAVPGKGRKSGNFGSKLVPQVMDTGANKRRTNKDMGYSFDPDDAKNVELYMYRGPIYNEPPLETVEVRGDEGNKLNKLKPMGF